MRDLGKVGTAILLLMATGLPAKTIYVDGRVGNDSWTGEVATESGTNGPVRTFARATALIKPGDTLSLSAEGGPYRESLRLIEMGDDDLPIVVEGNNALIELGRDVSREDWKKDGAGWICQAVKAPAGEMKKQRAFGFFRGAPFVLAATIGPEALLVEKTPEGLLKFYLPDGLNPPFDGLYVPGSENGVRFQKARNVRVRNLHVKGADDDGFSFHGPSKNLVIENCTAILCGDEGASAHGSSAGLFSHCVFAWNGSKGGGVVDVHQSDTAYEGCFSAFQRGAGYDFEGGSHRLTDCFSLGNTTPENHSQAGVTVSNLTEVDAGDFTLEKLRELAAGNPQAAWLLKTAGEVGWEWSSR